MSTLSISSDDDVLVGDDDIPAEEGTKQWSKGHSISGMDDLLSSGLDLPRINENSPFAASAKQAARINASFVPKEEIESLLLERQRLLDRMFSGTITRKEENRLSYVRWSLDRVEDATRGAALDALEAQVDQYGDFLSEINKFYEQLQRKSPKRRK